MEFQAIDHSDSSQKNAHWYGLDCITFMLCKNKRGKTFWALDGNNDSAMYHNYQNTRW